MLFWFVLIIDFENNWKNQYIGGREIHPSQMEWMYYQTHNRYKSVREKEAKKTPQNNNLCTFWDSKIRSKCYPDPDIKRDDEGTGQLPGYSSAYFNPEHRHRWCTRQAKLGYSGGSQTVIHIWYKIIIAWKTVTT